MSRIVIVILIYLCYKSVDLTFSCLLLIPPGYAVSRRVASNVHFNSPYTRQQSNWQRYSFMHTLCSCHLLPCHETFQWWTAVMLADIFSKCAWDGSITGGNYSSCPHNSNQAVQRSVQLATPCSWGVSFSFPDKQNKLHGLSPLANYTDRATAACRRSGCQLLRIKGAT
jgi:hypothetical protein